MDIMKPNTWFKSNEENEREKARAIKDEKKRDIAIAEVDHKFGHISKNELDKRIATANGESQVKVLKMELEKDKPGSGFFELDFNEDFVEYLANNGYEGSDNDKIVDNWFNDLCKNIVMEGLEDDEGVTKSVNTDSKDGVMIRRLKTGDDTQSILDIPT